MHPSSAVIAAGRSCLASPLQHPGTLAWVRSRQPQPFARSADPKSAFGGYGQSPEDALARKMAQFLDSRSLSMTRPRGLGHAKNLLTTLFRQNGFRCACPICRTFRAQLCGVMDDGCEAKRVKRALPPKQNRHRPLRRSACPERGSSHVHGRTPLLSRAAFEAGSLAKHLWR